MEETTVLSRGVVAPSSAASLLDTLGEIVSGVVSADQMVAVAMAWRTRMIEQAATTAELMAIESPPASRADGGWSPEVVARRTVSSELAAALRVPERTAENLLETAKTLVRALPRTMTLLSEGRISYRHAERVAEHSYGVAESAKAEYDTALAAVAPELTVPQLDDRARRLRERLDPASIEKRARAARDGRRVDIQPSADGMAWLSALMPAEQAVAAHSRLTDLGLALRRDHPDDTRTLAQLRADAFADLLVEGEVPAGEIGGESGADDLGSQWPRGIRARVMVTVPVLTLMGVEELPANLDGYGPIAPDTARELAAGAPSFSRILTHPETGAVLSVGRDSYAVPADLKRFLRVRDGTCRAPGCRAPAARCDIDHTKDWQHSNGTDHDNLAHLCRTHHNLKHRTRWRVNQLGDGVLGWTSPTGRSYLTRPAVEFT